MTLQTGIPKRVEEVLATHRRDFLKSAGLLVVGFATGAKADAQTSATAQRRVPILIPISANSTLGLLSMRTIPQPFTWAKPTADKAPARHSAS